MSEKKDKENNRKSFEYATDCSGSFTWNLENNKTSSKQCKHPPKKSMSLVNLLPPKYFDLCGRLAGGDVTDEPQGWEEGNEIINGVFKKRLHELEEKVPNALAAKLDTYKDWVSVLLRLNKEFMNGYQEFKNKVEEQLESYEACENLKCLQDNNSLVKLIRQAFHFNNWSLVGMRFETITPAYIMGLDENKMEDLAILNALQSGELVIQRNKADVQKKHSSTDTHIMALAIEVAGKHDEINRLKQQVCCLEDEIQNAQKKIQLKDDVIRELRFDLKNSNKSLNQDKSNMSVMSTNCATREMASGPPENVSELCTKSPLVLNDRINKSNTSDPEWQLVQNLEYLKNQLQEILSASDWEMGSTKIKAERLRDIFMKLETDKNEAFKRLQKIKKAGLEILMVDQSDEKNIFLTDNDEMWIQAIQDHVENMNSARKELSDQVHELLVEKGEIIGKMEALNNINRINCDILKELADLLSSLTNETINYNEIYSNPTSNPFCKAVCDLKAKLSENIVELTEQLAAANDKHVESDLAVVEANISDDRASCFTRNTGIPQHTTLHLHLNNSTPTPYPRQKNRQPDRKIE